MKKFKGVVIDADFLIFEVTEGSYIRDNTFANEKVDLKPFKVRLKKLIKDIVDEIHVELLGSAKVKDKLKICFSDPNGNFRYGLYPDYKNNRRGGTRSDTFYAIRKWAHKKYGYVERVEADDVVAYYARKGWVTATFDKDILKGCEGAHFDVYHTRRHMVYTSIKQAYMFNLLQTLTGDPTDGIVGIPRVAEKTAVKLLDEFGWNWIGVVTAYECKGLTEEDAILNRRLVCMRQWTPKKGVKLWTP